MIILDNLKKIFLDMLFPKEDIPETLTAEKLMEKAIKDEKLDRKEIVAPFSYKDSEVKKLVWLLKYRGSEQAVKVAAEVLHQEILSALEDWTAFEDFQNPVLIPVPLSKKKLAARGYNQTEMIVREIENIDENRTLSALYDVLQKKKETSDQTSMKTKKQRLGNLKGCFTVKNKEKIIGRNIIIVDDVTTTGATINEIKKVLRKNGVRKIKAAVIAH